MPQLERDGGLRSHSKVDTTWFLAQLIAARDNKILLYPGSMRILLSWP